MDFNLTEPQRMFRDSVATFARKELAGIIRSESQKWGDIVSRSGAKAE